MDAHHQRAAYNLGFHTLQIRSTMEALLGEWGEVSPYTDMARALYPVKAAIKRLMPSRKASQLADKLDRVYTVVSKIRTGDVASRTDAESLFQTAMTEVAEVETAVAELAESSLSGISSVLYEAGRLISFWERLEEPRTLSQETLDGILLNLRAAGLNQAADSANALFRQLISDEDKISHSSYVWRLYNQILRELDKRIALEIMQVDGEPISRSSLTGLPDLAQFDRDSRRYLENPHQPLSVAFIDMDNLKALNKEIGHDAADEVILQLAGILVSELEHRAVVYHRSGDEFLMVFKNTEAAEAKLLLDRLVRIVAEQDFVTAKGAKRVTISGGIASYPFHADNFQRLKKCANEAMQLSKDQGKSRVSVWEEGHSSDTETGRTTIE